MGYDIRTQAKAPFATGKLELDNKHEMYFQQSGNPNGEPVVILHGGPGAGIAQGQRSVFNSRHYRIIEFDQRGSGKSTPFAELSNNTTAHLIGDIEKLRHCLNIAQWLVMGGSWGSTLAIAYAEQYPHRVSGLLLRGIFLCSNDEINWYLKGVRNIFPEAWHQFIAFLPKQEQDNPLLGYTKRLNNPDPDIHNAAARAWCYYETRCSTMLPELESDVSISDNQALTLARIQVHYFNAGFFISEKSILDDIHRIQAIPTTIVQGRYDMICPITTANKLHRMWPESDLKIIPNAGHSASEPGIHRALVAAAQRFQKSRSINELGVEYEQSTNVNV